MLYRRCRHLRELLECINDGGECRVIALSIWVLCWTPDDYVIGEISGNVSNEVWRTYFIRWKSIAIDNQHLCKVFIAQVIKFKVPWLVNNPFLFCSRLLQYKSKLLQAITFWKPNPHEQLVWVWGARRLQSKVQNVRERFIHDRWWGSYQARKNHRRRRL